MTTAIKVVGKIPAAFLALPKNIDYVYGNERRRQIAERTDLLPDIIAPDALNDHLQLFESAEVIFSTWGMPELTPDQLARMPRLHALFYAAGSCRPFARPLLERGILVSSAWRVNSIPVAEFTLAQILLSCKGYWCNVREYTSNPPLHEDAFRGRGNYGETIALLGMGAIGRALVELLRPFHLRVIVFDPFLDPAEAQRLGVEAVSLSEAFARGYVVSNHLADNPQTEGLIDAALLHRLRPDATFINTGRGRTVKEADLVGLLEQRPDVTALLDVTHPEPVELDSPLRTLPNAHLSAHIAGSINDEVQQMADSAIAEFDRYARGEPLHHAVTLEMLATMA